MPRLLRTVGRTAVVAGTASATAGAVHRRQQGKWAEQDEAVQQEQAAQQEAVAQQQAPPPDDPMAKLTELAKLHEQGVLTDEEFSAAKAKLLGT